MLRSCCDPEIEYGLFSHIPVYDSDPVGLSVSAVSFYKDIFSLSCCNIESYFLARDRRKIPVSGIRIVCGMEDGSNKSYYIFNEIY